MMYVGLPQYLLMGSGTEMKDIGQFTEALAAVVGLAVLVGALFVGFKASFSNARIKALREDNEDLRLRVDDLDKEMERRKTREVEYKARLDHLQQENETLREMVLQRGDIARALELLDEHHEVVLEGHRLIMEKLDEVVRECADG